MERIRSWLRGPQWVRLPDSVERLLAAYYWDGAAPAPHEVRQVSPQGAFVLTSEKWYPGTIMELSLQFDARGTDPAPKLALHVRAKVVSHGPDGVDVAFLHVNQRERQELVKFLDSVRARGGQ